MGQIAASALGVPLEYVRVIEGDTDAVPYGGGTYASRATAIGGEATYQAARALREEILKVAGALLQSDAASRTAILISRAWRRSSPDVAS